MSTSDDKRELSSKRAALTMGSDGRLPTPAARARRSIAAARSARDSISNVVESLRITKPPRAPAERNARRRALIPTAEGRDALEARIRSLEDLVVTRDSESVSLKRMYGRALVKRRAAEKERDAQKRARQNAEEKIANMAQALRDAANNATEASQNVSQSLSTLHAGIARCRAHLPSDTVDQMLTALSDIEASMNASEAFTTALTKIAPDSIQTPRSDRKPQNRRSASVTSSMLAAAFAHDDDAHSCNSYVSSSIFGEDRETQIDTLVDLVDILEAKVAVGPSNPRVDQTISRARHSVHNARPDVDLAATVAERDSLQRELDAVLARQEAKGGEDAALAMAAKAEAELREALDEVERMRERVESLERVRDKALMQDHVVARNAALQRELDETKKTIARLVQERNSLRRSGTTNRSLYPSVSSPVRPSSDVMQRVQDWRMQASTEAEARVNVTGRPAEPPSDGEDNHGEPVSNVPTDASSEAQRGQRMTSKSLEARKLSTLSGLGKGFEDANRASVAGRGRNLFRGYNGNGSTSLLGQRVLPDRVTADYIEPTNVRRALTLSHDASSDRSGDISENGSVQSLPPGIMGRQLSFASLSGLGGESGTIAVQRDVFAAGERGRDGLRGLLSGSNL